MTFGVGWTPIQVSSGIIGAFGLSAIALLFGDVGLGKTLAVFGFIILIGVSIIISIKEPRVGADT
ncbi:hypothetical protein DSQ20_02130 [Nitrosarchaeum sp. AC2]|nr:hypothetical protein DSQ20_02130 [Nitrosarchaeum sp. AC2]